MCKASQVYGEDIYTRESILAGVVPLDGMQQHDGASYKFMTQNTAGSEEIFRRVQSVLNIPPHHTLCVIRYFLKDPHAWHIRTMCCVDPWPIVGTEDHWEEQGIWRRRERLHVNICHGERLSPQEIARIEAEMKA